MHPIAKSVPLRLLVLLSMLLAGCLAESEPVEVAGKCGPRDLTPECCLKQNPGQWEQCTGSTEMVETAKTAHSVATRVVAAGVTATVALQPRINSAEHRGAELAVDLLLRVDKAIAQCVRRAEREVNDYHFDGRSPSRELCQQLKVGEQTTWAAYLGLFKHEQAWPCLRKALDELLPKKNYLLHPRFRHDGQTGKWEFLDEQAVKKIVSEQGWKGLTGSIEPDIVILDEKGFIVHVYDLKFPCPETNVATWTRYKNETWKDWSQGDLYKTALGVTPKLVSPREGVVPETK
ncbi:hypothetical protein JRI60_07685 [Archangium violaceum]|uniref:hypothetical protein n=1 Tax=Archangium violaceum TaxID=83451 RepID=UPI00194F4B22|nr:hypothetical protein [Archangium violaceum]QRN98903.1 hypothetical protein JRI60_07685 [Archangium violaceum]